MSMNIGWVKLIVVGLVLSVASWIFISKYQHKDYIIYLALERCFEEVRFLVEPGAYFTDFIDIEDNSQHVDIFGFLRMGEKKLVYTCVYNIENGQTFAELREDI